MLSPLRQLFSHSSHYFAGRALILFAGFISMPILTRILTTEDYGIMSLVFPSLTLITTLAAFGFPNATTRFYPEYLKHGGLKSVRHLCTNMSAASFVTSILTALLVLVFSYLLSSSQSFADYAYYLRLTSVLIVIRVLTYVYLEIYRVATNTFIYNLITGGIRYTSILLNVLLVIFIYKSVKGIFVGTIFVEGSILILCTALLFHDGRLGFVPISKSTIFDATRFGFPLVLVGALSSFMAFADRFFIQHFLDSAAVAQYSIPYDLSEIVATLIITPVRLAVVPIVFALWFKEGHNHTSEFFSKVLNYISVLAVPSIFGFCLLGDQIIQLVASQKYVESHILLPYIMPGVFLALCHELFSLGLVLEKKTILIFRLNLLACICNIILNYYLIPKFSLIGAACATLITYVLLSILVLRKSSLYLKVNFDYALLFKSIFISVLMAGAIIQLNSISHNLFIDTFCKVFVGIFLYMLVLLMTDKNTRIYVIAFFYNLSARYS